MEIAAGEQQLARAVDGDGSVVVIEAPEGNGKSVLLSRLKEHASERGMRVLQAYGTQLERDFPFGVAIQLFEPWWLSAGDVAHRTLQAPALRAAATLLDEGPGSGEDDAGFAIIHGLFRLGRDLAIRPIDDAEARPLGMFVDDVHWADAPSLQFLAYLADRIAGLPIALVIAIRLGEDRSHREAVAALRKAAVPRVLGLRSLSPPAVREMVRSELPLADDAFCRVLERVTDGNPFLLREALEQVRLEGRAPNEETAARLEGLAPSSVLDAVIARLGAMPAPMGAIARAVAILGDAVPLRRAARLSGLEAAVAAQAADALSQIHLLREGEPLSFIHPLIRFAVEKSIAPLDRGLAHRRAADILDEEGESPEAIAAHLLATPAQSDPRATEVLRQAAETARSNGALDSAIRMLRRALAEDSTASQTELIAELAEAEAEAGMPEAVPRLLDAARIVVDPRRRAELDLAHGALLHRIGQHREAAAVLSDALGEVADRGSPLARDLTAVRVAALSMVPGSDATATSAVEHLLAQLPADPSATERAAIAHATLFRALRGGAQAEIRALVDLAWGDGLLLRPGPLGPDVWSLAGIALLLVDDLERHLELCDAAFAWAKDAQSDSALATANHSRAWGLYLKGEIAEATAAAHAASRNVAPEALGDLQALMVSCHVQLDHLDAARAAVVSAARTDPSEAELPSLLLARAAVRFNERDSEGALVDALQAGELLEQSCGGQTVGLPPWRSTAAVAHLALGHRDAAHDLASDELALAEASHITRLELRNRRILGLAEGGEDGIQLLESARSVGENRPDRLEYVKVLIALGSALRRANRRAAAREPLVEAIRRTESGRAPLLERRAREEFRATGVRVRSAASVGRASLTPSEHRVALLASQRMTTREIAQSLFVTSKTVEFHLRHIYQKLGVNSRNQLAGALTDDT